MQSRLRSGFRSVFSGSNLNRAGKTVRTKTPVDSHLVISQQNICSKEKLVRIKRLADTVKEKSTLLEHQKGSLPVYKVPLTEEQINVDGCKQFCFGKESIKTNRTIMVFGATGAGKSTLINGMINYILGVKWDDSYRFKLVDEGQLKSRAESQTSEVTVYKINHQEGFKINYSLTIVDTPGFGDTGGIERDEEIIEHLRNLFSAECFSEIAAVCYVAQAALTELTPSQKRLMDSVLSIFGKDVAENIRVLVTFADGQQPPVLEAINASGVPCPKTKDGLPVHFKFNNSALFADNKSSAADSMSGDDEDDGCFDHMFWDMGTKSMKRFFVALDIVDTKGLTMTKEVLRERERLENLGDNLQKQVKEGLTKLEEIKEATGILKEYEAETSRNEKFEFESSVLEAIQIDISGTGIHINNCKQCHYTCHCPCRRSNKRGDERHCRAMGSDGYCTVCPGKCYWNEHRNQRYKWDSEEVKEIRTMKELKKKYLKATESKKPVQALIEKLIHEYKTVQAEVETLIASYAKCQNRLEEIALKPNRLFTPKNIDMLIEGEQSEAKSRWKQRVQPLIAMRELAEYIVRVDRGEKLLPNHFTKFQGCNQGQRKNKTDTNTSQDNTETNTKRPRLK